MNSPVSSTLDEASRVSSSSALEAVYKTISPSSLGTVATLLLLPSSVVRRPAVTDGETAKGASERRVFPVDKTVSVIFVVDGWMDGDGGDTVVELRKYTNKKKKIDL